jgi:hypothetical protein
LVASIDAGRPFIDPSSLGLFYPFELSFSARIGFELREQAEQIEEAFARPL